MRGEQSLGIVLAGVCLAGCSLLFRADDVVGGTGDGSRAGGDAGEGSTAPCEPGELRAPTSASVETFGGAITGGACRVDAVLGADDVGAGLDGEQGEAPKGVGPVSGCLRVSFGASLPAQAVRVRARSAPMGCAGPCSTECDHELSKGYELYLPRADGDYDEREIGGLTSAFDVQEVAVDATIDHVVLCRGNWAPSKPDVEIDFVELRCK